MGASGQDVGITGGGILDVVSTEKTCFIDIACVLNSLPALLTNSFVYISVLCVSIIVQTGGITTTRIRAVALDYSPKLQRRATAWAIR